MESLYQLFDRPPSRFIVSACKTIIGHVERLQERANGRCLPHSTILVCHEDSLSCSTLSIVLSVSSLSLHTLLQQACGSQILQSISQMYLLKCTYLNNYVNALTIKNYLNKQNSNEYFNSIQIIKTFNVNPLFKKPLLFHPTASCS